MGKIKGYSKPLIKDGEVMIVGIKPRQRLMMNAATFAKMKEELKNG